MSSNEPLAIVGVGCRLPGGADSPSRLWELLRSETDATCVVPETRWHAARYYDPNPAKIGKIVTSRGGFLPDIDQFDPQFFGMSPREAHTLDPQQRLLLQATWEALEDGGLPADELAGTDVGVFVGGFTLDYQLLQNQGRTSRYGFKSHSATGMMMTMLANRISYAFDLRGPSMTVDTACSSSLVAVHLAAQSIWNGECELAIAGGVNVMIGPNTAIAESKSGFLSPEGRSKAFDDSADGYARGEGGAVVVIKPLRHAQRDGDDVYAQILGTAVSQDGHTDGITVPREEAQEAAIRTALARAGVEPAEVGYVEAHGTGTPVGDPIEMRALANALTSDRPDSSPLLIGSIKTNIGHLEAGAGIAGLVKAALVLKHGYIPASLHLRTPTRHVSLADLKIDVAGTGRSFPDCERRIAGVNSFGFGGTNAHVVLAESPTPAPPGAYDEPPQPALVLPISARSDEALIATAARLAGHLDERPGVALRDVAYTLGRRRTHLDHRYAVVADTVDDARRRLRAYADRDENRSARSVPSADGLVFVCTGMGPQWWGMCRGLLDAYPAFTDAIARTDHELSRYADWSLLDELRRDESRSRMAETEYAQPANFAIQVALAEQLAEFGIRPSAVIGHSAGEVAAHHLAGLLTFEQAVHVIFHRSRLQQRTSGRGRMLAVGVDADTLTQTLDDETAAEFGRRVSVAAINGPAAVTVGGDGDVLDEIARQLEGSGIFTKRLTGSVPYHTHHMDAVRDDLLAALEGLSSKAASIPLYSTVTGERLDGYQAGAAYWWQNTRATVLFEPAVRRLLDDGYTDFVELGPHPVLAASIRDVAGAREVLVAPTQRRDHDDARSLLDCVGALYGNGHDVTWAAVNPTGGRLVELPSYPWQTKRFWNETTEATESLFYDPVHPLLGQRVSGAHPTWEAELSTVLNPFLADHRVQGSVVVPGSVYVEMALAAGWETFGTGLAVDDLVLHRAVLLDETCDPVLRTTLNEEDGTLEFAAFTATIDGELKWTVTATAELNTLAAAPRHPGDDAGPLVSLNGAEFYARTESLGFDYGAAFRCIRGVTAGEDWAVADVEVPTALDGELDDYRFHPALIDGALQTLFGAPFLGQQASAEPYLPTRIRHSAVHGPPAARMRVHVRVRSATQEQVESDIAVTDLDGNVLAVFDGFSVQSLSTSSRMSAGHVDRSLYEVQWIERADPTALAEPAPAGTRGGAAWLVLVDEHGVGAALADELRSRGHRVRTVTRAAGPLADVAGHLDNADELAGVVDCWPIDMVAGADETNHELGVLTVLRLVKSLARHRAGAPRLHLVTANAQPAPGSPLTGVDQAAIWGMGRVIGHQEFPENWGGLVDVDAADDPVRTAVRLCTHLLDDDAEDQIALRGEATFVPRLRPCASLTKPFPTKLRQDGTYVVTGGTGALGRVVATHLAERGARHVVLLSRSGIPPRERWADLTDADPHADTIAAIERIERLGASVTVERVDVADAAQVAAWLARHDQAGGRRIRGIVHAAGTVADQLLATTSEADFVAVLAPKITGTRVLHDAFAGRALEFFVMFGSVGSTIAAPGQGNYAAANAYLDAFAVHRRAQGLPALTIGWGPWSVGMVAELGLEALYAQRGIELITPAVGGRMLDRLINQDAACVVAITADWSRARQVGLGGRLPAMLSELDVAVAGPADVSGSILDVLAVTADSDRPAVVADCVRGIVATVFDCGVDDFGSDDMLDDIGLDSMMAMDFRVRISSAFAIDVPVLEILRGVSVNSLSHRLLTELRATHGDVPAPAPTAVSDDDLDQLMADLSPADLRALLAELEGDAAPESGGAPS